MNYVINSKYVSDWILAKIKNPKCKAFQGWPKDIIEHFIYRIFSLYFRNIRLKMCINKTTNELDGILIAKIFDSEKRVHVSQIIANDKKTFSFLLRSLYKQYKDWKFSYQRRQRSIICKSPERFNKILLEGI